MRSGLRMADFEFVMISSAARDGLRNSLDDMRDVRTSERIISLVGSLAMEGTSEGGRTGEAGLVERCRQKVMPCCGKVLGVNPMRGLERDRDLIMTILPALQIWRAGGNVCYSTI